MLDPSTPLRDLPLAVIDFETTALPGPNAHVVSVAVAHVSLGAPQESVRLALHRLVRPPVEIPESATDVHGITDADVADAPPFRDVLAELAAACEGRVLTAYNAPADFTFVSAELARMGLTDPAPFGWPWLDLLVINKATVARGAPGTLLEVSAARGIVLDAHGAAGDALASALIADGLMREAHRCSDGFTLSGGARAQYDRLRYRDDYDCDDGEERPAPVTTLGGLLRWQRDAAFEQEAEYLRYRDATPEQYAEIMEYHRLSAVEKQAKADRERVKARVEPPRWPPPPPATWTVRQDGHVERVGVAGA